VRIPAELAFAEEVVSGIRRMNRGRDVGLGARVASIDTLDELYEASELSGVAMRGGLIRGQVQSRAGLARAVAAPRTPPTPSYPIWASAPLRKIGSVYDWANRIDSVILAHGSPREKQRLAALVWAANRCCEASRGQNGSTRSGDALAPHITIRTSAGLQPSQNQEETANV
jgi:hypothetical protein